MNETSSCQQCGAVMDTRTPEGLCPRCVLATVAGATLREAVVLEPAVPATESTAGAAGRRFGDYQLLHEIARGGMGVVFKARQISLNRTVAVKMIQFGPFASESSVKRFRNEALAAASLHHPNIVAVHEVGEFEGQPYFSMDYVEGKNLTQVIAESGAQSVAFKRWVRFVKTMAEAMHYAHQRGILHRDLKPSNVLIDLQDQPRITDFGLAKRFGDADPSPNSHQLTLTGQALGSPSYMPPEQAGTKRGQVGPQSDIYSLGAILYHLLTARPPFVGETLAETLQQVQSVEPIGLRLLNPRVPRDLETICLKCLNKDPQQRYASAEVLGADLDRWLAGEPIQARPIASAGKAWRWCRRNPMLASLSAATALLVVTMAVGAPIAAFRINLERNRAQQNVVHQYVANGNRLVEEGDLFGALPWFANALKLDRNNPARARIHRLRLAATIRQCPRLVECWFHSNKVNYAEFSPDGSKVVTACQDGRARIWDAIRGELVSTIGENSEAILVARFSPDERWIATASAGHHVRVWDAATGKARTPILSHKDHITSLRFSPDGRRILTASEDHTAMVWEASTGEPVIHALKHDAGVARAAFSPDGSLIVTAGRDATARVWNAATGEPVTPPLEPQAKSEFTDVVFCPDGRRFATADVGGRGLIWDAATGQLLAGTRPDKWQALRVAFSPDGGRILTGHGSGTVRVWDAASGLQVLTLGLHKQDISTACFSGDGRRILTANFDGTVRLWNASSGEPAMPPLRHGDSVRSASFSPDGRQIVTASDDRSARVWDLSGGEHQIPALKHGSVVHDASFSRDGRHVITIGLDETAWLWDLTTGAPVTSFPTNLASVRHAQFSHDGQHVAIARSDGTARVWDLNSGRPVGPILQHKGPVNHVEFSPDGQRVVTGGADGLACVWEIASGRGVSQMKHTGAVNMAWFTADGSHVLTATVSAPLMLTIGVRPVIAGEQLTSDRREGLTATSAQVRLWNADTGQELKSALTFTNPVSEITFSPDRRLVVASCADPDHPIDRLLVWNVATGKAVTAPLGEDTGLRHASFSADSRRVTTVARDNVRVWDARTGEPLGLPMAHEERLADASFSPDGRLVVTASLDRTARVWDAATGEPVTPPLKHDTPVNRAFFAADGRRVLTATSDGRVHVWDLPVESRPVDDDCLLAQFLAGQQIRETGGLVTPAAAAQQAAWQTLRSKYPAEFATIAEQTTSWERREVAEHAYAQALAHKERANSLFEAQKWREVIKETTQAISHDPEDFDLYYERAGAYVNTSQFEKSADDYTEALKRLPLQAPNYRDIAADLYLKRCYCHEHLLEYEKAVADCQQALNLVTNHADAIQGLNGLAWDYANGPPALRSPEKALSLAQRTLELDPGNLLHVSALGIAYFRLGQFEKAKENLLKGLEKDSGGDAPEWIFLAMSYQRLGDSAKAHEWYGKALKWRNENAASLGPEERQQLSEFCAEAEEILGKPK
jgi:WD40 repeat protein/tetratricopeptide (TPR) repeat protein